MYSSDFYNCKASFSEAEDLQPWLERAFDLVGAPVEGITFFHIDDELTCIAVSGNAHICIHAYPPCPTWQWTSTVLISTSRRAKS